MTKHPAIDPATLEHRITKLKSKFRRAVILYRGELASASGDCGANLAAYMNPRVAIAAKEANDIAVQLRELDPEFPKNWIPYPEGD